jgi:hypothetical protein
MKRALTPMAWRHCVRTACGPGDVPAPRARKINHLHETSSPLFRPMPTMLPFRFGYTGQHCRRGGIGDPVSRPDASGAPGAAQKMVCLSSYEGACVCRTHHGLGCPKGHRSLAAADGPELRGKTHRTGHAECHYKKFNSRHPTCPGRTKRMLVLLGRAQQDPRIAKGGLPPSVEQVE